MNVETEASCAHAASTQEMENTNTVKPVLTTTFFWPQGWSLFQNFHFKDRTVCLQ